MTRYNEGQQKLLDHLDEFIELMFYWADDGWDEEFQKQIARINVVKKNIKKLKL